jgi:NitT/TauT family transport system permease protein
MSDISTMTPTPAAAAADPIAGGGRQRRRRKARDAVKLWLTRLGVLVVFIAMLVVFIAIWGLLSGRVVDAFYISSPRAVWHRLWGWVTDGQLTSNLWVTLEELVIGFVIGAVVGMVAGLLVGLAPRVSDVIEPFVQAIYSVPKIALMPLFIVWFGISTAPKILLAAVSVVFVVFYTTLAGVRDVDRSFIDVLRVMGATRSDILRKVIVPGTLTWIFTGLTISVPQAFIGAVAGEILVSNRGIGYLIQSSATNFDTAGVFAGIVVILIIAAIIGGLLRLLERRALRWKAV